jgi:hypothetical protein
MMLGSYFFFAKMLQGRSQKKRSPDGYIVVSLNRERIDELQLILRSFF